MQLGRFIRDNRATLICGLVLAIGLCALFALTRKPGDAGGTEAGEALVALVHDGAGQVHELPLDVDDELVVRTPLGSNTILVEDGAVRMAAADCPNGDCLRQAPLAAPGAQLICLPHELWVEVVPRGASGGALDVRLVSGGDPDVDLQAR